MQNIILLMHCPDQKGIIAAVTDFIHHYKGNIIYIDQYVDRINNTFFMRVEVEANGGSASFSEFQTNFNNSLGVQFGLKCDFYLKTHRPRMAVFVSQYDHCLYDILAQQQSGRLHCEIPFIISNHTVLQTISDRFDIPFYHIPITKENKLEAEQAQLKLLKEHNIESIVLARYMQILTAQIIDQYPQKVINIHHSFLPAFPGAKPYHSAFERGVKIIGATSHYVTEDLDAGPIIEQDTVRVSHGHEVKDFLEKGQDLERLVLLRALKLHCDRKIMVYNNKTVVFN